MRKPVSSRHDAGFTLVELLVSLALLAMTAVLLLATLSTGQGVERRASGAASASESIAAAHGLLRDRIEAMVPEAIYGPGDPIVEMQGESDVMNFLAAPAAAQRPAPPQRFRLLLTRAGELSLFSIDPLIQETDPGLLSVVGWSRAPLIGNVARLDITYFGAAPPDGLRRWRSRWYRRPELPELVRIRIAFAAGDRRVWPDLVVRPAATLNSACVMDRTTGRCRRSAQ
ncbi:prepilin-type N-terminal cleavage/methylation domain-containing protein [Sandarakinorhabdus sp.]|uniref:prepilin-type N-terminal cleavage/methylation domain-containing protein n=1 Tax=Sandarakinorhabdus sp. TaxID=1916663 RepID=UPI00286DD21B|nr:prepilin-type N-terminal cleavage/methylation domain-containing protein [Sandarakinorhabdus sp.]